MSTASVSACDKIDFAEINVKDMPLLGQVMICIQGEIYPKIRNSLIVYIISGINDTLNNIQLYDYFGFTTH